MSRDAEALAAFQKAHSIDPDALDTLFNLGMAYAELRQRREASDTLLKFLATADESVPPHLLRIANATIARMQDVI